MHVLSAPRPYSSISHASAKTLCDHTIVLRFFVRRASFSVLSVVLIEKTDAVFVETFFGAASENACHRFARLQIDSAPRQPS